MCHVQVQATQIWNMYMWHIVPEIGNTLNTFPQLSEMQKKGNTKLDHVSAGCFFCDRKHLEYLFAAFLIEPRIPETVLIDAPVNLLTSRLELNIPLMKAVFFMILYGSPMSFSFFIILNCVFISYSKYFMVSASLLF